MRGPERIVAAHHGVIHLLDAADGSELSRIETGLRAIHRLQVATSLGVPTAFLTGERNSIWCVELWDLTTGKQVRTRRTYIQTSSSPDLLQGLALKEGPDGVRFAFAGRYSKVMVADHPERGGTLWPPAQMHFMEASESSYTYSLAAGTDGDVTYLAAGSDLDDDGLAVWDFATGRQIDIRRNAHAGPVRPVCFASIKGRTLLVSGGQDGFVRLWTPRLHPVQEIDVGEPIVALARVRDGQLAVGSNAGLLLVDFNS
jgi:WD40 repeat protein